MVIHTIKTSKKQIRAMDTNDTLAFAIYDHILDQHTIFIHYRASTKTRLHEIAHCILGHCLSNRTKMPVSEYIAQEVEAEEWASQKCGKSLSLEAALNIAHQVIVWGIRTNLAFNTSLQVLAKYDYRLTRKQRSYFWNSCMEVERDTRGGKNV